ncbi:uncharacterized protein [Amphiura filiformis]|uniref:uncharacterized protein n=1 Tax=Amphiura filiformis TaxID=82378 RepID=UPI003B223FB2
MLEENFPDLLRALGDSGRATSAKAKSTVPFGRLKALQCSICLDRFKTPKSLPCLHTFCSACLTGVAPRGTRSIACPLCRQQAVVPDQDATKFPTNFLLRELIEEESKREQLLQKDSGFTCTCCDNKSAVQGKCDNCNQYLCADGVYAHKRLSILRDHKVLVFDTEDIEPRSVTKAMPTGKPQLELKTSVWAIFDALYDEEHSTNLFGYWMGLKGESTWRESMASHYLTCLQEGALSEDEVVPRYIKVAHVFKQAGQYSRALNLVQKILKGEKEKGRIEPETLANLYYLGAEIYREMLNAVPYIEDLDPEHIKNQIDYARKGLEIRRDVMVKGDVNQDDNKFEIGRLLRVLAAGLGFKWDLMRTKEPGTGEEARGEAKQCINESVEIFSKVTSSIVI